MFAIKEKRRVLGDGTEISTYIRDIYNANVLEVEAGTNGLMGGDSGHGSRTYFCIEDAGSTDMKVHAYTSSHGNAGLEVTLGGDCELETIISALKFITKVLEDESNGVND